MISFSLEYNYVCYVEKKNKNIDTDLWTAYMYVHEWAAPSKHCTYVHEIYSNMYVRYDEL